MIWIGHIPKRYKYNPALPPTGNRYAWLNMFSPVVERYLKHDVRKKHLQPQTLSVPSGVEVQHTPVSCRDEQHILLYKIFPAKPEQTTGSLPVIYFIHGGAFYYRLSQTDINLAAVYASMIPAVVFVPDYRGSFEAPFPVPFTDCIDAYLYLKSHADELGINPERISLIGASAGGCLAASLSQYLRDHEDNSVDSVLLSYPVLENTPDDKSMSEYKDAPWPKLANDHMWQKYVSGSPCTYDRYAMPGACNELSGLPPAYIEAGESDILRDAAARYATRLKKAGVQTVYRQIPGAYHGFDWVLDNPYTKAIISDRVNFLKKRTMLP